MSIKVMSAVWERSQHKGSALLLLLALADFANDTGECWPAVGTLAHKIRMSDRSVSRLLQTLIASGELAPDFRSGRSTMYKILTSNLGISTGGDKLSGVTSCQGGGDKLSGVPMTPVSGGDDIAMSSDPSITKKDIDQLWDWVLNELKNSMTAATFNQHFLGSVLTIRGDTAVVGLKSTPSVIWVTAAYKQQLQNLLRVLGADMVDIKGLDMVVNNAK